MMTIQRYHSLLENEWNDFVGKSKNGTFLLDRRYMDYHSDRFRDHSLMVYDEKGLLALFPANEDGETLYSHQGLTYGGLITDERMTTVRTCDIFCLINSYLREHQFRHVVYKAIPWIYHILPAEEDLYALFKVCDARLIARDISSAVMPRTPVRWRRDRHYGANKAATEGIVVEKSNDYEGFWAILTENLHDKYNTTPVHSLKEIRLLSSRFPNNILLYLARHDEHVVGGTVLYCCGHTIHAQYISANPEGKRLHAIDAIYKHILTEEFADKRFVDFGKSTEQQGSYLNETLIYQKEGFGGRAVCYDWYQWDLKP